MSRLDQLLSSYRRHVALPQRKGLHFNQRVWFVVYSPEDERRLQQRILDFEIATKEANLFWHELCLTGFYTEWINTYEQEERQTCLSDPSILESYKNDFLDFIKRRVDASLGTISSEHLDKTVVALTGTIDLYDFAHVSEVIGALDENFPGTMLVFFPGEREGNVYRFLGARDGWDYLAVPILPEYEH